ncbi:hyper-sensitivity-related 4-like protein [Tanacetum coccineum]
MLSIVVGGEYRQPVEESFEGHKVRAATDVVVLQAFFNSRELTIILYESVFNRAVVMVVPSTRSSEAYIANNDRKLIPKCVGTGDSRSVGITGTSEIATSDISGAVYVVGESTSEPESTDDCSTIDTTSINNVVVVDISSLELDQEPNDADKITLSRLLNFIYGLWSSCWDERIIVFITNHKDSLDEALLRPGRMDVHLEMSYCTYVGFKVLASTYLQVKEEEKLEVFHVVKCLLEKVKVTLAEIANQCN